MNLHLCINDRFIELFIQQVALYTDIKCNKFIIYGDIEIPFSNYEYKNITLVNQLKKDEDLSELVESSSRIYIHYLTDEAIDFLNQFELSDKKIIWVLWGIDGFSIKSIRTKYSIPFHTPKVYYKAVKEWILLNRNKKKEQFIKENIGYLAHYIEEDFYQLKPLMKKDAQYVHFSYGSCDKIVKEILISGNDLIIGNSSDPANYHEWILEKLLPNNFELTIHCPLSYGGEKIYNDKVAMLGQSLFGRQFIPYLSLLTPEQYYNEVLEKCAYAIMFHNKSQAWGNIMQLLSQGTKVFMNPDSSLFRLLEKKGFAIYSVKRRLENKDFEPLSSDFKTRNKLLLEEFFGQKQTRINYSNLLDL